MSSEYFANVFGFQGSPKPPEDSEPATADNTESMDAMFGRVLDQLFREKDGRVVNEKTQAEDNDPFWSMFSSSSSVPWLTGPVDPTDAMNVDTLSVKELRDLIKRAGLSDAACFEKADLVKLGLKAKMRLQEAAALRRATEARDGEGDSAAAARRVAAMDGKHPVRRIAGFDTIIVGEERDARGEIIPPDFLIFFFHGYQVCSRIMRIMPSCMHHNMGHELLLIPISRHHFTLAPKGKGITVCHSCGSAEAVNPPFLAAILPFP